MGAVSAGSAKTGIFSENAGAGQGRQRLHFAMNEASDTTDATLADSRMTIMYGGKVGIGTTSPTVKLQVAGTISGSAIHSSGDVIAFNTSDERLKDNIETIANPLEKINKLKGVRYEWNSQQDTYPVGNKDSGIIAQDVQVVLPELVRTNSNGYLGVRHDRLVGLLIEGIKEQQQQIDELKQEVEKLKGDD